MMEKDQLVVGDSLTEENNKHSVEKEGTIANAKGEPPVKV